MSPKATQARFRTIQSLAEHREQLRKRFDTETKRIYLCSGTGCRASGSEAVAEALLKEIDSHGLSGKVELRRTGCHGFCQRGPIVIVQPGNIFYQLVAAEDAPAIIGETLANGRIVERLLYDDPLTAEKIKTADEIQFYSKQQRVVFRHNGKIDPTVIDDYIAADGYEALEKVLSRMKPDEVVEEVTKSGLRGRGGAGFPTGVKWGFCRKAAGEKKYVICNADEGDPGAFMDRSILEGDPHAVIEGMLIGAFAIGARHGVVYVRTEYPLAIVNLGVALDQCRQCGLLGENILGTGLDFDIEIHRGAGAFVCGEETALIASVEGRRGMPTVRPPYPAISGLWGCPTNINNVETWANIPVIITKTAGWFASIGTEKSKGTKVFSLVGKVNNTGLVEVPMGMPLREIVEQIGGGTSTGLPVKAVQLGGPSGGCIPSELMDTPVDYDAITGTGAIVGSGGMVVMDTSTCMVDVARFFLTFTQNESCGKCVPCRVGTKRMLEILTRITEGEGRPDDVERLQRLGEMIKRSSLCGLGQTAPNPVLSTIRYFRDEYEAHIAEKRCPAGACKALVRYGISEENCIGCGACRKACPVSAITGEKKVLHVIDQDTCIKCGMCKQKCKFDAVLVG